MKNKKIFKFTVMFTFLCIGLNCFLIYTFLEMLSKL